MQRRDQLLGDVLEFYDHMRVPLSSIERDTRQGEYRYYGAQGVIDHIDNYIFDGQFVLIAEDGANLVTRNEPIAFLVDGRFWVNNHAHVVKGKDGVADDYYVTRLLNSMNIAGFITGAAQPKLSQQSLKLIKVALPNYDTQRRIVAVFSAYDGLIDNNRKRIALLEEAARLLYREWFVHLRFPGHEHVRIVDGVPDAWQRLELGRVLTLKRGYDLPAARRASGPVPVVSSSGVTGCHTHAKASGPGVVTGRYGTLGEVYFIETEYWPLNTALYVSDFKGHDPFFVFQMLKSLLRGVGTQKAAVPGVDRNVLHKMLVVWPSAALRRAFVDMVRDNQRQIRVLTAMNDKLAEARDLLLPRLMSGEIAV